jgi:hypothetical protein
VFANALADTNYQLAGSIEQNHSAFGWPYLEHSRGGRDSRGSWFAAFCGRASVRDRDHR